MDAVRILLIAYIYLIVFSPIVCKWWSASIQLVHAPENICRKRRRVRGIQAEVCKNEPEIVEELVDGIKMSKSECMEQFKDRRWNCTSARRSLRKVLRRDTRETGFVNTLAAAGATFAITKGCSMGNILTCTCDRRVQLSGDSNFHWGGCGDNIIFGYKKSKEFMDARWHKRRHDLRTQILLHNYEAGRQAVTTTMTKVCKCHGLTGSCSIKTCWMKTAKFNVIGKRLKNRFNSAVEVMAGNDGKTFVPRSKYFKSPNMDDIVYSERSPNYCEPNRKLGSFGTRGRVCNEFSHDTDGCNLMCCDRGFERRTKRVRYNCRCRFEWCCEVKCDTCEEIVDYAECN